MLLDDVLKNPLVKKAVLAGEERVGRAVGKLLSSDGLTGGLQALATTATQARQTLEKGVSQALHAANLPTRDDVEALKRRLEELEAMLDGLSAKVSPPARAAKAKRPRGDGGGQGGGGGAE